MTMDLASHPLYTKFQTCPQDLMFFFEPNLDLHDRHTSRDRIRAVMAHFGVDARYRRSSAVKADLIDSFKAHLLPLIKPFIKNPANIDESAIIPDEINRLDLGAKSCTKAKIRALLKTHVPHLRTTPAMDKAELVKLYRQYVLKINPPDAQDSSSSGSASSVNRFVNKPPIWTINQLKRMRLDDVRSALQFYRPDIFIISKCMTLDFCTRLYEKFLLNMEVDADVMTEGVHYYIRQ